MSSSTKMTQETLSTVISDIRERMREVTANEMAGTGGSLRYFEIGKLLVDSGVTESALEAISSDLRGTLKAGDFSTESLYDMTRFYRAYRNHDVLKTLVEAVDWQSHRLILNECRDDRTQEFYIRMTRKFEWTPEVLKEKLETFRPPSQTA
jgi:hypothetical protein